jgi:hypothetical protein
MAVPSGFCRRKNLWLVSLLISCYVISQIQRNSFTDCCTLNFNKQTKLFGSWKQSIILVVYYDYIYHKKNFFETRRNIVPWLQWMEQQNFKCFHSKPPRWDSYVVWALHPQVFEGGKKSWVRNVNLSFFLWYLHFTAKLLIFVIGLCVRSFTCQRKNYLLYLALIITGICVMIIT